MVSLSRILVLKLLVCSLGSGQLTLDPTVNIEITLTSNDTSNCRESGTDGICAGSHSVSTAILDPASTTSVSTLSAPAAVVIIITKETTENSKSRILQVTGKRTEDLSMTRSITDLATTTVDEIRTVTNMTLVSPSQSESQSMVTQSRSSEEFHRDSDSTTTASTTVSSSSQSESSSLTICPPRIVNPTYTPSSPLPTDYTWGCPPYYLCQPDKYTADGTCNFEAGPPADTYYCSPGQCIPSPPLLPPQHWGRSISSDQVGHFEVSPGYFNLNPHEFGLGYSIFEFPDQPASHRRQSALHIPGQCYDECNNAMLEAEASGKTPHLCENNAAFKTLVHACQSCVDSVNVTYGPSYLLPQFQQFYFYCKEPQSPLRGIKGSSHAHHVGANSISTPLPYAHRVGAKGISMPIPHACRVGAKEMSTPLPLPNTPDLTWKSRLISSAIATGTTVTRPHTQSSSTFTGGTTIPHAFSSAWALPLLIMIYFL